MVRWAAVLLAALLAGCGGDGGSGAGGGCEGSRIVAGSGAATGGYATPDASAPASEPFTICFENKDDGVPHNVVVTTAHHAQELFAGEVVTGPADVAYEVEALAAGEYHFHCEVHPDTMQGVLTVG